VTPAWSPDGTTAAAIERLLCEVEQRRMRASISGRLDRRPSFL
jgi:hypothetical protein